MTKRKIFIILSVLIITVFFLFLYVEFKLFPIVEKMSYSLCRNYATRIINESVQEVMLVQVGEQDEIIRFQKNEAGEIVSLSTDARLVNLIKSYVSLEVERRISEGKSVLQIPLGNILGMKTLSGRGPKIKVRLTPVRSVVSDISSIFSESGINQTLHKVFLKVEMDVGMMVLSRSLDCRVSDTVVICETVIVGKVPDAYTDINKIEDEVLGDIVDFSASAN